MRRASFVGPLILIGIGVLFLCRNLFPDLPLMDYISRFWPFLLIGWGLLRLIEIGVWAATSKPLPSRGMSGGEWVLVVFLVLIGSAIWSGHRDGWLNRNHIRVGGLEIFGEAFDYPINGQKTAAGAAPQIVIESFRGNARISGSDSADVKVTGRKTVRALNQADADKANQATPFEVVTSGSQIIIRTNQDRANSGARVTSDLEITVPKGSSISASGRYGDFDVNDITGAVEIISDNAGVRMQNIGGNVRVDTRRSDIVRLIKCKGPVDLKGHGTELELQEIDGPVTISAGFTGMVQFRALAKPVRYEAANTEFVAERVPGQVRMTLSDVNASNVVGPIRLHARSKDVQLSDFKESVEISLDRGDVELRPGNIPLGKMDVRTRSGDIEFAIPDKAKLDLNASTDRGEITNDFGSSFRGDNSNRGSWLKGAIGDGPRVALNTGRGAITVRKASSSDETTKVFPNIPSEGKTPKPPKPPREPDAPLKPVEQ